MVNSTSSRSPRISQLQYLPQQNKIHQEWEEIAEKVVQTPTEKYVQIFMLNLSRKGGKAKPLKAPKKEKRDLDEDEIAYREKQKAGESSSPLQIKLLIDPGS